MDTDIVTGIESGMETILVLTGVTREQDVRRYPYQPTRIAGSIGEIEVQEKQESGFRSQKCQVLTGLHRHLPICPSADCPSAHLPTCLPAHYLPRRLLGQQFLEFLDQRGFVVAVYVC